MNEEESGLGLASQVVSAVINLFAMCICLVFVYEQTEFSFIYFVCMAGTFASGALAAITLYKEKNRRISGVFWFCVAASGGFLLLVSMRVIPEGRIYYTHLGRILTIYGLLGVLAAYFPEVFFWFRQRLARNA